MDSFSLAFVISVVFIAIVFEFINGFHDAANAIAMVVSTRVLKPHHAVMCVGYSCQHDPHDCGGYRGSRCHKAAHGRPLGRGGKNHLDLGFNVTRVRSGCRCHLHVFDQSFYSLINKRTCPLVT
jgi:hypothetical protein